MPKATTKKKSPTKTPSHKKDIILFVDLAPPFKDLEDYQRGEGKNYRYALIYEKKDPETLKKYEQYFDIFIKCKYENNSSIAEALSPYRHELLAISCRAESRIPQFARVVPHVPYLRTPNSESLVWSVNKISMRRRFRVHAKKHNMKYRIVKDATQKTREAIEKNVGFPCLVKPSGLAQSLLVQLCYHQQELDKALKNTFRKINKLAATYKGLDPIDKPRVLVEQFIEGDLYSVDGQVNSRGKLYCYPPVQVKTGQTVGFDDFFGYKQICPAPLSKKTIEEMNEVVKEAIHALGIRSSSFHVELIRNDSGWKIVEAAPRVGGFRSFLYDASYGIDYTSNDIRIRIPRVPEIPKRLKGHSAAMKFYAKKEGLITAVHGIQKAKDLASFKSMDVFKKVGSRAHFAKNGGKAVFHVFLFNKDRSKLLADIRRLEKMIKIDIK